ncbi:tail fiber protein [Flavobacterium sp.]|uniref:phage tail protein n=1 Tax=Flavobacterium sp. TaxID=239 RepID=UPI0032634D63
MKKIYFTSLLFLALSNTLFAQNGEQILGEIKLCGFNYAPQGFAICNGQLLPISNNEVLYALLGTTYGGDGINTFALPNYQGRALTGVATNNAQGTLKGTETVTLTAQNIPSHSHDENFTVNKADATSQIPVAASHLSNPIVQATGLDIKGFSYNELPADVNLNSGATSVFGSQNPTPVNIMQPYLVLNYIIAVEGIFPSRP